MSLSDLEEDEEDKEDLEDETKLETDVEAELVLEQPLLKPEEEVEHDDDDSTRPMPPVESSLAEAEWTEQDERKAKQHLGEILEQVDREDAITPKVLTDMINATLQDQEAGSDAYELHKSADKFDSWVHKSVEIFGKVATKQTIELYIASDTITTELCDKIKDVIDQSPAQLLSDVRSTTILQVTQSLTVLNDFLDTHTADQLENIVDFMLIEEPVYG